MERRWRGRGWKLYRRRWRRGWKLCRRGRRRRRRRKVLSSPLKNRRRISRFLDHLVLATACPLLAATTTSTAALHVLPRVHALGESSCVTDPGGRNGSLLLWLFLMTRV